MAQSSLKSAATILYDHLVANKPQLAIRYINEYQPPVTIVTPEHKLLEQIVGFSDYPELFNCIQASQHVNWDNFAKQMIRDKNRVAYYWILENAMFADKQGIIMMVADQWTFALVHTINVIKKYWSTPVSDRFVDNIVRAHSSSVSRLI